MMLYKLLSARTGRVEHAVVSLGTAGALGPRIEALGVPVHSLGLNPSLPNPWLLLRLRRLTQKLGANIVQGWMPHGNLMATMARSFRGKRLHLLWNIRMSLSDVHKEPWITAAAIRWGARLSVRASAIIYNSRTGAAQHEAIGYSPAKRVIIANGFDIDLFRPDARAGNEMRHELGIAENQVLIGLIARYHPMKDHAGFLKAAAQVARAYPSARFLLAGKGISTEQHALRQLMDKPELRDRVILLSERTDTPRVTAALDIACSASAWGEGFSNSIGEAMACGLPCVVTDIGDSGYLVGTTGACVPAGDPAKLAEALAELVRAGHEHRRKLGQAARERIEREFSLPVIVQHYEELYQAVLANKGWAAGS